MNRKPGPEGIIAPALTPFGAGDEVDLAAFTLQVEQLIEAGVHGVSPGGSTGEGATLEDDELVRLIDVVQQVGQPETQVVAGVIRSSTSAAIRTGKAARDAGAHALMVTPTFYNVLVPDDDGNYQFYERIAEAVGLPIVIYNVVPQNEVSPTLFTRLLEIDQVVGIKQSVGGIMTMYDMVISGGGNGRVFAATDEMLHSCFALGADGAISAILSLFPRLSVAMWDLTRAGRHAEARAIQDRLFPVWKVVRGPQFPARMKAAMRVLGHDYGLCRSPSSPVPPELTDRLLKALGTIRDDVGSL